MKKHILIACIAAAAFNPAFSQAPAFAWVKASHSMSNPNLNNTGGVAVDTINNVVYATGSFGGGGINFGNGDFETSSSANCAYLVKYNLSGTLLWSKAFNSNWDNNATGVGVDNSGNVYVTGYSQSDTVQFGGQYLLNSHPNSTDHTVGYVVKFDANGNTQWIKGSAGGGGVVCEAIAVDAAGNSYITGHVVDGSGDFMGHAITQSGFYAKISSSGTLGWFQQTSPIGVLIAQGTSIALDHSGNLAICGTYAANINFGSVALAYNGSSGTYERFVAKMDVATGTCAWAKTGNTPDADYAYDVTADSQNNIFVTGTLNEATPNGNVAKQFVEKLNASGNSQWLNTYTSPVFTPKSSIVADKNGNVFVTFNINDTTVYGNYTISPLSPLSAFSTIVIAVVKIDPSGTVMYAKASVGPVVLSYAQSFNLALDQGGDLFIAASISHECKFDGIDLQPSDSNSEFAMAKLGNNVTGGGGTSGIRTQSAEQGLSVYPNPANSFILIKGLQEKASLSLIDLNGKTVVAPSTKENKLDVAALPNGAYILEINTGGEKTYRKIIISGH